MELNDSGSAVSNNTAMDIVTSESSVNNETTVDTSNSSQAITSASVLSLTTSASSTSSMLTLNSDPSTTMPHLTSAICSSGPLIHPRDIKMEKDDNDNLITQEDIIKFLSDNYKQCEEHSSEMLEKNLVCVKCKKLMCALCLRDFHEGHPVVSINKLREFKSIRDSMEEELSVLQLKQRHLTVLFDERQILKKQIESSTQSLMQNLNTAFDNFEKVVKDKRVEIGDHITAFQKQHIDDINKELDLIKSLENEATVMITRVMSFFTKLNPHESTDLQSRLKSCIENCCAFNLQSMEHKEKYLPERKFSKILPSIDAVTKICATMHPEATKVVWSKVTPDRRVNDTEDRESRTWLDGLLNLKDNLQNPSVPSSVGSSPERNDSPELPEQQKDKTETKNTKTTVAPEHKSTPEKRKSDSTVSFNGDSRIFKKPKVGTVLVNSCEKKKGNSDKSEKKKANSDTCEKRKAISDTCEKRKANSDTCEKKKANGDINDSDSSQKHSEVPDSAIDSSCKTSSLTSNKSPSSSSVSLSSASLSSSPLLPTSPHVSKTVTVTQTSKTTQKKSSSSEVQKSSTSRKQSPSKRKSTKSSNSSYKSRSRTSSSSSTETEDYNLPDSNNDVEDKGLPSLPLIDFDIMNMTTGRCIMIRAPLDQLWVGKIADIGKLDETNFFSVQWLKGEVGKSEKFDIQDRWKRRVDTVHTDCCICHFEFDHSQSMSNELMGQLVSASSVPPLWERRKNKEKALSETIKKHKNEKQSSDDEKRDCISSNNNRKRKPRSTRK